MSVQEVLMTDNNVFSPLPCKPEEYYDDIAHLDITQEEADELLKALWEMMSTMVNIGWGVESVQIMLPELMNNLDGSDEP
jgi:hypothetical protein